MVFGAARCPHRLGSALSAAENGTDGFGQRPGWRPPFVAGGNALLSPATGSDLKRRVMWSACQCGRPCPVLLSTSAYRFLSPSTVICCSPPSYAAIWHLHLIAVYHRRPQSPEENHPCISHEWFPPIALIFSCDLSEGIGRLRWHPVIFSDFFGE